VNAAILEAEGRADDEILHGGGDEDLAGSRQSRNASPDRDGDSRKVIAVRLDLTGVQACPQLNPLPAHRGADRSGAPHGARWSVERGEEPVAQTMDLLAAEAGQLSACDAPVLLAKLTPAEVAKRRRLRRKRSYYGFSQARSRLLYGER
jgi:hypothetical protein